VSATAKRNPVNCWFICSFYTARVTCSFSSDLSFSSVPRQYMVLVPFMIHTDSVEKVCVQLTHLNESVTLSVTLDYQGENRSLIDDVVSEKDVFTCIPFSVSIPSLWVTLLTVMVKGPTLQFSSRKLVVVQNSDSLVFVQTDKPIYKPGQTVLFRIVSLDEEFRPVNEMVSMILDPKKNRLYQWTNVEFEMGFIQLFFNLTSEPIQGTYTVVAQKASGKTIQHSFSVEEYVLPKFEVTVKMPKVISILDEELKVTVCGLYTFGKPVPGLVNFRVCRKYEHAAMSCYGEEARAVCEEFSGQTDIYGCISEVVKTKLFQLKRSGYENKLHVEAKIKEEDTGVELTGTSFSEITTTISKVTFVPSDTYYKRGVPFFGQHQFIPLGCLEMHNGSDEVQHKVKPRILAAPKEGFLHLNFLLLFCLLDNGVFSLQLSVQADIAPVAQVLVYTTVPSREVVADSAKFYTELCFNNKVDLSFSPSEGLPSSDAHLLFRASPNSLCAVRAVDKSVLLMKPEADLSPTSHDADIGLACLGLSIVDFFFISPRSGVLADRVSRPLSTPEEVTETVRKYFPETWIWSLVPEGKADLKVTIPDTITEWKANAFCTSAHTGFGLSPTVSLRAFQPFFVELTMPYSVVRGESFTLKATVFNYLPACIRVSVTLAQSTHFLATLVEKEEESHCLCENVRKTVAWLVTPKSLGQVEFSVTTEALQNHLPCGNSIVETPEKGRKDTVIRQLLVEPEGIEKETTQNSVLCVKGDIMGTAMQNLHQLLQMPFGCGEQNMVLFAPNIYVLDYLNKTGQLSEEIKSKATGYLVSGYQRQLNYKHQDGSYSTFGPRFGQPGNTWLTAFVVKSFAQARHHIFIEEKHIHDALNWLSYKQKENGCFQSSGTLLNNAMKGGVDNEVTLTAYITIALLEIPLPVTLSVVRNALFCLETAANQQENHVYTKALLAYAFALAGNREKRKALLDSLGKEAIRKDGSVHWQRPGKEPEANLPYYRHRAPSAEVEMTAYVLLAHLTSQPGPAQDELSFAALIAKWISSQQNPNGGFSSTQDTVVALQALSLYGAVTYAKSGAASNVALRSAGGFQQDFQVDPTNRLLLQRLPLPQVPGDYSVEVSGEGCVYLQTSLRYNVQPTQDEAPFTLHVYTVPETCVDSTAHKVFDIGINVSYTGERNVSNMVIVDVKMLSGFIPLKSSVRKLERHHVIERTELNTNHVLLYLEKLGRETLSFSFTVERDILVRGLKPAQVKVYDYYETDEFATQEYSAPCTTGRCAQTTEMLQQGAVLNSSL
uniref:Alpha-2-macroglobulin n=1 Tax=Malurus cyaneus samueli TaxID=2593467 RepID=A0A8C5TNV2_9PASS